MQPKTTFSINAAPTFDATVSVPVPGGARDLVLTFKHKTRAQVSDFQGIESRLGEQTDGEVLGEIVAGWTNVQEDFSEQNLTVLCQNFPAAPEAIIETYLTQLGILRRKN